MKKIFWFLLLSSSALITVVSCQQNDQKPIKIKTINQKLPADQQTINNKVDNKVVDLKTLNLEIDKLKSNLNINKLDIENFVAKIASYKKNLAAKDELIDQTLNSFTTFLEQQNFQIEAKREQFIDFLDQFFNLLNSQDKNNDLKNQDQKLQTEQKEIERLDDKFSIYPGQNHFEFNKNGDQIITDQYRFDNPDREVQHFQSLFGKISTGKTSAKLVDVQAFPKKFNSPEKPIINLLDEKAKSVNQPLYENAQKRAFSLPDLDSTGKIIGLKINNFQQGLTTPAWWGDSLAKGGPNRLGLPRLIPNEKYLKLAKSSIGVTINNGFVDQNSTQDETKLLRSYIPAFSTWNIIDYKLEENGKYPLTWYFLTNAHVANTLRLANDFAKNKAYGRDADNYNEKFKQYNTWSISLNKLKSNNELKKVLPTTNGFKNEDFYQKVTLRVKEKNGNIYNNGQDKNGEILINQKPTKELNVRTIVIGTNVLKSKPSDFSRQKVYQNLEEIFDFAIIELTFDNEADAKKITYDYFRDKQDHFRVSKLNLLDAQEYKKFPLKNFYGLGWPLSKGETLLTLSKENDSQNWQTRNFSQSPWVNKPLILFNNSDKISTLYDQGGNLAWSRSYRSFVNLPGLTDYFISTPLLSSDLYKISHYDAQKQQFVNTSYILGGQGTILDNFSGSGGLSGTNIYLGDGSNYSLLFAGDNRASASLTLNLRSYGYDYQGYYGGYNLPAYDLIYGSVNQNKSYWDAMNQLYGSLLKTNLFPKGFGDDSKIDVFANSKTVNLNNGTKQNLWLKPLE